MEYVYFEKFLWDSNSVFDNMDKPIGYENFANALNNGAHHKEKQYLTTFVQTETGPYMVFKSEYCFTLNDSRRLWNLVNTLQNDGGMGSNDHRPIHYITGKTEYAKDSAS